MARRIIPAHRIGKRQVSFWMEESLAEELSMVSRRLRREGAESHTIEAIATEALTPVIARYLEEWAADRKKHQA